MNFHCVGSRLVRDISQFSKILPVFQSRIVSQTFIFNENQDSGYKIRLLAVCQGLFLGGFFLGLLGSAAFEGEFGDAGFVEFSQSQFHHCIVLLFGGCSQGQVQFFLCAEGDGNSRVFGGVGCGEVAVVIAFLHVFAISFEDAGVGSGLGEHFAKHFEIVAEGRAQAQSFGQSGGVDVHDHVDKGFDFGGGTGRADVAHGAAELGEERFDFLKGFFLAAAHEVKCALLRLGNAGGHAGFDGCGAGFFGSRFDFDVGFWGDCGAVDENLAFGVLKQAAVDVADFSDGKDFIHCRVVGDDGENDVCKAGQFV